VYTLAVILTVECPSGRCADVIGTPLLASRGANECRSACTSIFLPHASMRSICTASSKRWRMRVTPQPLRRMQGHAVGVDDDPARRDESDCVAIAGPVSGVSMSMEATPINC
jgi:hypothetical protein